MSLLDTASLLLTPNAYKEGKLYSVIPSDGSGDFTFTRATTATRVNSDGLVELVPYNLVQRSQEFDNAYWSKGGGATITSNSTTAPDGTLTADTLNVATSAYSGISRAISGSSLNYTVSIYAKKNTKNWLYLIDVQGGNARAWFDLDNGVLGTVASGYTATITNVGNGWYRCTLANNNLQTLGYYQIGLADANNGVTPTSSGSAYIWGAQLVEGTNALPYQKTETRLNIPRIDYSLGGCPSILLEPQRTNLLRYSQQFENGLWSKTGNTVTPNQAIAPDGTLTMDLITFDSAGTFTTQAISVTSGATYTFSVWLATTSGTQTVEIGNINISTWQSVTVTTTPQRFEVTQVASGANRFPGIRCTAAYSIFAWGAQIEAGSYATSYIPTTTASVTRNDDVALLDNIYANGLITASGGTWFLKLKNNIPITQDSNTAGIFIADTTIGSNNTINIIGSPATIRTRVSAVVSNTYTTSTAEVSIAIKWDGVSISYFVNGVKVLDSGAFAISNMRYFVARGVNVKRLINEMALFPTPLTDDECTQLTTI